MPCYQHGCVSPGIILYMNLWMGRSGGSCWYDVMYYITRRKFQFSVMFEVQIIMYHIMKLVQSVQEIMFCVYSIESN